MKVQASKLIFLLNYPARLNLTAIFSTLGVHWKQELRYFINLHSYLSLRDHSRALFIFTILLEGHLISR